MASRTAFPQKTSAGPADPAVAENQPLSAEHAELFVALDRLLSIGSYYTPDHARYQEVARRAHAAIKNNLSGAASLEIECTAEGFYVHDIFIEGDQQETRRIFELMDALNIGLLEIQAVATTSDLHEAMSTLKRHQVTKAGVKNYEEIEINDLPDTITTTSQSLHVRTKDPTSGPGGTRSRAALADYSVIPDANLASTPEGQKLEREFLNIISGIMMSGDATHLLSLDNDEARNSALRHWVSDSAIHAIKEIIRALEKSHSDPMVLEHLIGHAQAALRMTGDADLVELIFDRLRKETGIKGDNRQPLLSNRPKPKKLKSSVVKYTMTPEQMNCIIDELNEESVIPDDLLGPSTADCLGICAQIMCSAPSDLTTQGISSTIFRILSAPTLTDEDLSVSVSALTMILKTGSRDLVDMAIPMYFSPLRKFNPRHLGPVWLNVWKSLTDVDHKRMAWPHLVNELLMGVEWEDPAQKLALFESLSRVEVGNGSEMLERLEELQALRDHVMEPELFHVPAPLLYPVHIVLLDSTMSHEHGAKLYERLAHQRAHLLANLLVSIMGKYKQSNKLVYQAILEQGVTEKIIPTLMDLGSRLLKTTLMNLSPDLRNGQWVSEAVSWLGRLDAKRANPILNNILKEKKYLILPVWPADCRRAARHALAARGKDDAKDER